MKTCGQPIIYTPDMYGRDCSSCAVKEYEDEIKPETPACGTSLTDYPYGMKGLLNTEQTRDELGLVTELFDELENYEPAQSMKAF